MATGFGNQRLYVVPSLDLVVARLDGPDRRRPDREFLAPLVEVDAAGPGRNSPMG